MKAYTTVKAISKGLMYFSAFSVLAIGGIWLISKNLVSADIVIDSPKLEAVAYTHGENTRNPDLPLYLLSVSGRNPEADHVSIFINSSGQPNIDIRDKDRLCSAVNNPGVYRVGNVSCVNGQCGKDYNWEPSNAGRRQILALFMKSDSTVACQANNIINTLQTIVDIPYGPDFSRGEIDVDYDPEAYVGQELQFKVRTSPESNDAPITHIALLIQKAGQDVEFTAQNFCSAESTSSSCRICAQQQVSCGEDGRVAGRVCSRTLSWTPSPANQEPGSLGIYKGVIVTLGSPLGSSDCARNIREPIQYVSMNLHANNEAPPAEAADEQVEPVETDSADSGFQMPEIRNPTSIKVVDDLLDKFSWIATVVIPLIALSSVIVGGYIYITSSGDDARVKKAKSAIVYGLTAIVLVFLAAAIVLTSVEFINRLGLVGMDRF